MPPLVAYMLLFVAVGVGFILVHLLAGKLIRPIRPDAEKGTIYECGEPTIGSAWVQFDLRFYVVALLFVIFDVEVAFFFPWAEVFGKANALSRSDLPAEERRQATRQLSLAFLEIVVFFGVLLVGFAYLWRRGDLHWVRALEERRAATVPPPPVPPPVPPVVAGREPAQAGSAS